MKHFKKLAGLLLAVIMTLAMCMTVMAADNDYTITIDGTGKGHTYEAYQIFSGKYDASKGNLSDINWGTGVNSSDLLTELRSNNSPLYTIFQGLEASATAEDVAKKLETLDSNQNEIEEFAKIVAKHLNAKKTSTVADNTNATIYTISGLQAGYYLVKDADSSENIDAFTKYILRVVKSTKITPKSSVPTSEKKVKDINDATDTNYSDWMDSADHDLGDEVDFRFEGTLPDDFDKYTSYTYIFHDKQSAGLSFQADKVKVYIDTDGNVIPAIGQGGHVNYEVLTNGINIGETFNIKFANLKNMKDEDGNTISVSKDSKIYVEYKSTLTGEDVVYGKDGNPNEMYLEYSNNPNGAGTGKTPDDKVIVFVYKTVINKVDQEGNSLKGAEFTLEKFKKQTGGAASYKDKNGTTHEGIWLSAKQGEKNSADIINGNIPIKAGTQFTFKGLDDGVYRLKETTTPDGYNTMKDIIFEIKATHADGDNPELTDLNGDSISGEITLTPSKGEGSLTATIENKKGSQLPETGGIGTTIFYVVGVVLMLGAGVLLITKRRMSAKH